MSAHPQWPLALAIALALCGCRVTDPLLDLVRAPLPEDVRFVGNVSRTTRELVDAMPLELADWRASGGSRAYADDAAFTLAEHYRALGFASARVEYAIRGTPPVLWLQLEEGPRVRLEALEFPGFEDLQGLTAEDLRGLYDAPGSGITGGGQPYYVASALGDLRGTIQSELRARGFLDAQVGAPVVEQEAGLARASLQIESGPRYVVDSVRLEPDVQVEGLDLAGMARSFERAKQSEGPLARRVYTSSMISQLRAELIGALQDAGYPDAAVRTDVQLDAAAGRADITAAVQPGPRVRVREVQIAGAPGTRRSFVRSRLLLEEGDLATADQLRDSLSRLYRTGLFKSVEARLVGDGPERALALQLEERKSRELFIEPGYGSYESLRLRVGARERNLWGTGRQLRSEATLAVRALRGVLTYTDPWFLREDLILDVSGEFDRRENPSFTGESRALGAYLTNEWDPEGRRRTSLGYAFRRSEVDDVEVVTSEVQDALDDVELSGLRLNHVEDRRDQPLLPARGNLLELSAEWGHEAFGSDLDYVRATLSLGQYVPLGETRTLALGLRAGAIVPTGDQDVIPLQERFFNGGENTVRSFREAELGPTDSEGNSIGGEAFSALGIELRQRVAGSGWQLALFLDTGHVAGQAEDFGDLEGFGWGVGVGLRYVLPVGPVRLDLASNPDAGPGEDDYVLHFAVGLAF